MRHRIFLPAPLVPGSEVEISGDEFHHAIRVVRAREGEEVELFDGKGLAAAGRIASIGARSARIAIEREAPSREARVALTLACAIIHLEKFELVLQKTTELGVSALIPLITDHVELRPERYRGKADRWEKIVFEAVKQSGRAVVPRVEAPATLDDVLSRPGTAILFDADNEPGDLPAGLVAATLLVGPEGGWSERELVLAREREVIFRQLGPRRLRAETAAIVSLAITALEL